MIEQDSDQLPTLLTSREAKELRALRARKNREESGRFIAEGIRVVEDLLDSPLTLHWAACSSSLEDSDRGRALLAAFDDRSIPIRVLPESDFEKVALTDTPQGVLVVAGVPRAALTAFDDRPTPAVILVLDAVQDPGNFGTLVRSAEALGAAAVIALPGTVDPWNPKAVRSAAGSSFRVAIVQTDWPSAAQHLRGAGYAIYGAAVAGTPVSDVSAERVAVVVGNEGGGLSEDVRREVDDLIGIPLRGRAESLNVAAAAAILLYELTR